MRRVLVATRNPGKLRELAPLLASAGWSPVDLDELGIPPAPEEDALESFDTFEENALAKARYFAGRSGGLPVLADDSGLAVDALGGAPGVRSKRWSGRDDLHGPALDAANNARLLAALAGASTLDAGYVCAAAWVGSGRELVRRGEVRGRIVPEGQGSEGFGYDPYFWSTELGRSFGEASREEKARVSHRARAVRAVLEALAALDDPAGPD